MKTIRRETKTVKRVAYSLHEVRVALGLANIDDVQTAARSRRIRVRIFMRVPGGADWSNTDLELGDGKNDERLIVEITETTHEETEE